MPLVLDITTSEEARVGVWRIGEDDAYFLQQLFLSAAERQLLESLRPAKKREWLASRHLLDTLVDHHERIETGTRSTGKPFLVGRAEEISLSHSDHCVAAMVGDSPVGVDIQRCKQKILQVEHKFANSAESEMIDRGNAVIHLHVLWGAKEALYKVYARKQLSFRSNILVDLPGKIVHTGRFTGKIMAGHTVITCILEYHILENYVLVYAQKTDENSR